MIEFEFYDGEKFITFDLLDINEDKRTVLVVVSDNGRITQREFDLFTDKKGFYIEYGNAYNKVYLQGE